MPLGIRVVKSGDDIATAADKDFLLNVDTADTEDNVLIKEKQRGTEEVNSLATDTIEHSLNYIPLYFTWAETSSGEFTFSTGFDVTSGSVRSYVDSTNIGLINPTGSALDFIYTIFYDEVG